MLELLGEQSLRTSHRIYALHQVDASRLSWRVVGGPIPPPCVDHTDGQPGWRRRAKNLGADGRSRTKPALAGGAIVSDGTPVMAATG
jgi:hypothetical protein